MCGWLLEDKEGGKQRIEEDETDGTASFVPESYEKFGWLFIQIENSNGLSKAFSSEKFTITGPLASLVCEINLDKDSVTIGQPITATWTVSGIDETALVSIAWYVSEKPGEYGEYYGHLITVSETESTFVPKKGNHGFASIFFFDTNGYTKSVDSIGFYILPKDSGDANGDGTVDIMDLVAIIDYIVTDTQPKSLVNADANGDGDVDIMDLVWIIDQIVGG